MPGSAAPAPRRVMTRCDALARDVFTGHRMRPAEREAIVDPLRFRCGLCAEVHSWTATNSWCEERPRS